MTNFSVFKLINLNGEYREEKDKNTKKRYINSMPIISMIDY